MAASDDQDRHNSSFRLEISIAVGYQRRRAALAGKWESGLVTAVLLAASIVLVLVVVWQFFKLF